MNERTIRQAWNLRRRTGLCRYTGAGVSSMGRPDCQSQVVFEAGDLGFPGWGREYSRGGPPEGPLFTFDASYQELVPEQRIVYTYTLDSGDVRISVSITTVELIKVEGGTKLIYTEQGAFFDGHDTPEIREHGTNIMLDTLGKVVEVEVGT